MCPTKLNLTGSSLSANSVYQFPCLPSVPVPPSWPFYYRSGFESSTTDVCWVPVPSREPSRTWSTPLNLIPIQFLNLPRSLISPCRSQFLCFVHSYRRFFLFFLFFFFVFAVEFLRDVFAVDWVVLHGSVVHSGRIVPVMKDTLFRYRVDESRSRWFFASGATKKASVSMRGGSRHRFVGWSWLMADDDDDCVDFCFFFLVMFSWV